MTNGEKYRSAEERDEAFDRFCDSHRHGDCECVGCELFAHCTPPGNNPEFYWLDLEAPEEQPLPCPFCGCEIIKTSCVTPNCYGFAYCEKCGYRTMECHNQSAAIAAHNRVARAAKEANDENV